MSILSSKRFQKYFVPGIVFQSCVIAGGYGTGRELVEYFMGYGPKGGLLGNYARLKYNTGNKILLKPFR